ncbi:LytR/AlgR family response regulator transcription factor [Spirosoma pulveris]
MKPITLDQGLLTIPGYGTPQPLSQISWLEGQGNYTRLHLSGQKRPLLVCQTLKAFEAPLPGFLRVSKGALINPIFVGAVSQISSKQMSLILLDGQLIRVSRRRIEEIATKLGLSTEKLTPDRMQAGLTQGYPYPGSLRKAQG